MRTRFRTVRTRPPGSRSPRSAAVPALLLSLLSVAGCGGFSEQDPPFPGQEPSAVVIVNTTQARHIGATVYISSTSGFRTRLGKMAVGGRREFIVRDLRPGPHLLEARLDGTREIRSREFMLRDGDAVEWDLEANDVFYRGPDVMDAFTTGR